MVNRNRYLHHICIRVMSLENNAYGEFIIDLPASHKDKYERLKDIISRIVEIVGLDGRYPVTGFIALDPDHPAITSLYAVEVINNGNFLDVCSMLHDTQRVLIREWVDTVIEI